MSEAARRATAEDRPQVESLLSDLLAELGALERGGRVLTNRELGPAVLDNAEVWVGSYDGVVVGFGTGRVERLRDGGVLGVIDALYVEPEARGVGVGEALMEELLAWFREQGCMGVDAMALPGTRETKNFFEENGFSARLLVVHKRLDA